VLTPPLPMWIIPLRPKWLSPLTLLIGLVTFVWFTPESQTALWPTLLGVAGSGALVANRVYAAAGRSVRRIVAWPLIGAGWGAGGALAAAALMFLKTAIHAHLLPEFPPEMMLAMLARLPSWAAAGALIGAGAALIRS